MGTWPKPQMINMAEKTLQTFLRREESLVTLTPGIWHHKVAVTSVGCRPSIVFKALHFHHNLPNGPYKLQCYITIALKGLPEISTHL